MSIRQGLLALLAEGPMYGYQLRTEFEARTGSTWPLNVGQVYTTVARLERDGLARAVQAPDSDHEGRQLYEITPSGRAAVAAWFASPVERENRPRDELAIKIALAVTAPGVDVPTVIQTQRTATLQSLQELTRLKRQSSDRVEQDDAVGRGDHAWLLVLDSLVFQSEAEVRWLDHCEARLRRYAAEGRPTGSRASAPPAAQQPGAAERSREEMPR